MVKWNFSKKLLKSLKNNEITISEFNSKINKISAFGLETIIDFMHRYTQAGQDQNKPPLLIVTNINQPEEYADIVKLSGARFIKKYLE